MPGVIATVPKYQFSDSLGAPLAGGSLTTYVAGTNTLTNTWQDQAQSTLNTNPILLDARGECVLWLSSSVTYKFVLKNSAGVTQWTVDNISGADSGLRDALAASSGSGLVGFLQSGTNAQARTVQSKLRETISVRDFGAVLDGSVDDAVAIQAALNAANGSGKRLVFDGSACKIGSTLLQSNHSHYDVDWQECQITFSGGAGTYLLDMTQAGRIRHTGGVFTGSGVNHFVITKGSAAAQATTYPTIPTEPLWARQLGFDPTVVTGFATVFDLQNFTREIWISGYITGNTTALKLTGKVVNLYAAKGTIFYSSVASSQGLVIRGDSGDSTYRYAEGTFLSECIFDTQGTAVDVRDAYLLDLSGAQIKTASGGIAADITKGVCPLTRTIFLSRALMQGRLRIGQGLSSAFLFDVHGIGLAFSDTTGTAVDIQAYTKGVTITDAAFNNGVGTPQMFAVGANCTNILLNGLNPDALTYVTAPTIDATSLAGSQATFVGSFTPVVAFGGGSTGVTYVRQVGKYFFDGGKITGFIELQLSNKGSSTGNATISGLPFQCKNITGSGVAHRYSAFNTVWTPMLSIPTNGTSIELRSAGGASEALYIDTGFSNSSLLYLSFAYSVN